MSPRDSSYQYKNGWYGDYTAARGSTETVIRSIAIHVVAAASYGHLMSLRRSTNRPSVTLVIHLVGYVLFPLLPLAQLLRQIGLTLHVALGHWHSFQHRRLYLAGILGMEVASSQVIYRSDPVITHSFASLDATRLKYKAVWYGRLLVLLALLVQFFGTVVLWYRRAYLYTAYYRLWALDTRNLQVAIGGIVVVLNSIGILLVNTEWKISGNQPVGSSPTHGSPVPEHHERDADLQSRPTQPISNTDNTNASVSRRVPREPLTIIDIGEELYLAPRTFAFYQRQQQHRQRPPSCAIWTAFAAWKKILAKAKNAYRRFRQLNSTLSDRILPFYPVHLQWDMEFAYVLHMIFYALFAMEGDTHRESGFGWKRTHFWTLKMNIDLYAPRTWLYGGAWSKYRQQKGPYPSGWRLSKWANIFLIIYHFPVLVISIHALLCAIAYCKFARHFPKAIINCLAELNFWARNGRTILSLSLTLFLFLPGGLQIVLIKGTMQRVHTAERAFNRAEIFRQPGTLETLTLWKDPWSDHLYVI